MVEFTVQHSATGWTMVYNAMVQPGLRKGCHVITPDLPRKRICFKVYCTLYNNMTTDTDTVIKGIGRGKEFWPQNDLLKCKKC